MKKKFFHLSLLNLLVLQNSCGFLHKLQIFCELSTVNYDEEEYCLGRLNYLAYLFVNLKNFFKTVFFIYSLEAIPITQLYKDMHKM